MKTGKRTFAVMLVLTLLLVTAASMAFAAASGVTVEESKYTLNVGENCTIKYTGVGKAEGIAAVFSSSDKKIATVDENGVVTAVSKGQATIYVKVPTPGENYRANVRITVIKPVEEIEVNEDNMTMFHANSPVLAKYSSLFVKETASSGELSFEAEQPQVGSENILILRKSQQLNVNASCLPKDASSRAVIITSGDTEIVRCNEKTIIGRNPGKTTITISSKQNPEITKEYTVLVVKGAESVKVTADTKTVFVDGTLQLSASVLPAEDSLTDVTWKVTEGKAASVDDNGLLTGISRGEVVVRAQAVDGSKKSGTIRITVSQRPESITINNASNQPVGSEGIIVNMGSYRTVKAVVNPNTANNKKVAWSSSDEGIAKINSEGRITPVSLGDAVITAASAADGSVTASINVHVHQLVEKITFLNKNLEIDVDTDGMSFYTIEPSNATDKTLLFSSSDSRVATVGADGMVHGVKRGEVTITAKAADSEKVKATYKVSVLQPVHGVSMKESSIRVGMDESGSNKAVLDPTNASNTRMTWTSDDETIAKVSGKNTTVTVRGKRWGTTYVTGTTEDGGYTTTFQVNVGDLNKALAINDLYIQDGKVRIVVANKSNMNIEQFSFTLTLFDEQGQPLACDSKGGNVIMGRYELPLEAEGGTTKHYNFNFINAKEPAGLGKVIMSITGYSTDDGYKRDIKESRQPTEEFCTSSYNPPEPAETPTPNP